MSAVQELCDWLAANGGHVNTSSVIREDPIYGLSAFATSRIDADQRLVSCPFALAITPELATKAIADATGVNAEAFVWPAESSQAGARWNERMRIATYIALHWVEREDKGREAADTPSSLAHWAYIAALPPTTELSTPLWFTDTERQLLSGTNLSGAIKDREQEWREESAAIDQTLGIAGLTWERYLAAATYLSSRAFPARLLHIANKDSDQEVKDVGEAGSHPILLPGIDLFNHSRGQPITWLSSRVSSPAQVEPIPSISLMSAQTHEPGTQIFNNYGPKPNDELLLGYGFVLDPNPDDIVHLKLGQLPDSPPVLAILERLGIDPTQRFILRRDGEIPKDLLEVLRVILSGGVQDLEPEDEEDEHALHDYETRQTELELEVCGTLGSMLDSKLETMDATEPNESIQARPEVRRMCTVYRQGQRDILQAALDKLEQRSDRLEKMIDRGMGGCSCCT